MPTVGTLACLVAASFVHVASQAPPKKETQPVDCSDPDGKPPLHLMNRDSETIWEIQTWDMTAGALSGVLWSYTKDSLGFESITSCGIGFKDSKVYCIVRQTEGDFVARMDSDGFAYLAKMPGGWAPGGTCDEEGALLVTTDAKHIWRLPDIDTLDGFSQPWDGLPQMEDLGATSSSHGFDVVVWEGWLVSAHHSGNIVVTDLTDRGLTTSKLSSAGGDELPRGAGCGAAFLSGGDLYVVGNNAAGLYKVEIQLEAGSFTATRVGESWNGGKNDGLYCTGSGGAPEPGNDGGIKDTGARTALPSVAALAALTLSARAAI